MRISHSFFAASFSRLALFFSFFLFSFHIFAQSALRGNVADEKGKALPGANIQLLKPEKVVISDENGNFAIENLPQGNYEIKISFIGFKPETRSVSLTEADAAVLIRMTETGTWLNSVEISAPKEMPFTTAVLSKKELAKNNLAQDMPFLLQNTPSVVSMSDGGTGVGYTNMRIRGSDNTRTNVTINGIPVNDAESQGVWWVNMPDFASSLESVQIQRGVGTSVNGAGAFGASVNLSTAAASEKSYVEIGNTIGSFNTFRHNIKFGTGKINQFFSLDARLSKVQTDGYIDNAWAKMKSFFVTGAFEKGKTKMTLNLFGGNELTFQAWNGVSAEKILAGERRYNELAAYDNEVDNYSQEHFQWIIDQKIGNQWQLYAAAHFTRGRGYFEQYKAEQKLKNYGLEEIVLKDTLIKKTDLIRRRWLDNYFYGALANLSYNSKTIIGGQSALLLNFGAGYNRYEGKHFGEVIWAKNMSNGNIRHRYYDNDAVKSELNAFAKAQYQFFEGFFAFADVQIRSINYEFLGYTAALQQMPQNVGYTFFNPKSGLRYVRGENEFYFSFARANREPNRDDFTNSSTESRPKFETLNNTEAGWQKSGEKLTLSANYYLMQYQNQLILT